MSKQEGIPKPEKSGRMSPEEIAAAKTKMDEFEYIGGKLIKRGSESHKKAQEQKMEEDKAKQREKIIDGLVQHQIEENPNAIVDKEQAKKYWGRFYDESSQGAKMDMQINEVYAKRYEEGFRTMKDEMLILEQKLSLAETEKEKRGILGDIEKLREEINNQQDEIHARGGYGKPKKGKGE